MTSNKKYPKEFKEYVSKLIIQDGRKMVDVSNELDIPYDTLQKWVYRTRQKLQEAEKAQQNQLLSASEYKALYEAERQRRIEAEEESSILKKAMHIFTQEKK